MLAAKFQGPLFHILGGSRPSSVHSCKTILQSELKPPAKVAICFLRPVGAACGSWWGNVYCIALFDPLGAGILQLLFRAEHRESRVGASKLGVKAAGLVLRSTRAHASCADLGSVAAYARLWGEVDAGFCLEQWGNVFAASFTVDGALTLVTISMCLTASLGFPQ